MEVKAAIIGAISIVIIAITLLALTPTIIDQVETTLEAAADPVTEWNFTGADGAMAMLGLVPFVWVAGILMATVVGIMVLSRGKA